jgi:hypothetical protein
MVRENTAVVKHRLVAVAVEEPEESTRFMSSSQNELEGEEGEAELTGVWLGFWLRAFAASTPPPLVRWGFFFWLRALFIAADRGSLSAYLPLDSEQRWMKRTILSILDCEIQSIVFFNLQPDMHFCLFSLLQCILWFFSIM